MSREPGFNEPAWDETPDRTRLPELQGDVEANVCVVGLGGSGLACVHTLLDLDQSVIGLDAGAVGGGAAGRNGGFLLGGAVAFHHKAVAAIGRQRAKAIYELTLAEIERFAAQGGASVRRTGSLRVASSEEELLDCQAQLAAMRADDLPVNYYDGPEGCGLVFPMDASFNPLARCRAAAHSAVHRGASLHENSRATSVANGLVRTANGHVRCRHVIVAVDGGLELVLPELAGSVRTARLQMLSTGPAPEVHIPRPVYSRWGYDYWQQLSDKRIVLGGGRDKFSDDEWTDMNVPTVEVQNYMETLLRDIGVVQPVQRRWAASVSYSHGILPVMEEVRSNVWAIGGYNGTGNVIGSLYGRMVSELVVTGKSDLLATLAPSRITS
jgi:glycine/D-amino acid oxidase-like deaminating enzyme